MEISGEKTSEGAMISFFPYIRELPDYNIVVIENSKKKKKGIMIKDNYLGKHNFLRGSAHPLWDSLLKK